MSCFCAGLEILCDRCGTVFLYAKVHLGRRLRVRSYFYSSCSTQVEISDKTGSMS